MGPLSFAHTVLCCMIAPLIMGNPISEAFEDIFLSSRSSRQTRSSSLNRHELDCMKMVGQEGEYFYQTSLMKGPLFEQGEVCALYINAPVDQLIEIEFKHIDVSCENGLVSVVDGWELMGVFFPSEIDHPLPLDARYQSYCGSVRPGKTRLHQNVGTVLYRIPTIGERFSLIVRFIYNPKPCNVISPDQTGSYTLTNYGLEMNCTFMVIYPIKAKVTGMVVGEEQQDGVARQTQVESKIFSKCNKRGYKDHVEILSGDEYTIDPDYMALHWKICGAALQPKNLEFPIPCGASAIRLVSSGDYYNSIEFQYKPLNESETGLYAPVMCFVYDDY